MHMQNRPAKLAPAIFAGVLIALATPAHGATPAAEDCLSGPKVSTSRGGHWYYRIDHASGRHCWYLGQEHEKLSRAAPSGPENPAPPKPEAALQPSIADARAELQAPLASAGPNPVDVLTPVMLADAAAGGDGSAPKLPGAEMLRSLVASRWPDSLGASSSAGQGPATANPVATLQTNSAAPAPDVAEVSNAADASSEAPSNPIRMLAIAMAGALSLAGLIAIAMIRFAPMRITGRGEIRGDRHTIGISAGAGASRSPAPADADDRIAAMLARPPRGRMR
jgi:hypothetical protein